MFLDTACEAQILCKEGGSLPFSALNVVNTLELSTHLTVSGICLHIKGRMYALCMRSVLPYGRKLVLLNMVSKGWSVLKSMVRWMQDAIGS